MTKTGPLVIPILELRKWRDRGTSLVVQWLRLHTPNAGGLDSIFGYILRWQRIPGEGNGYPVQYFCSPVFLPGESHGQKSLVGYSPWGYGHNWVGHTEGLLLTFRPFNHQISWTPRDQDTDLSDSQWLQSTNVWTGLPNVFSHFRFFVTPCTVARQDPLSMGFSRQNYWCGLPFPPPGDLPYLGIQPESPVSSSLQEDSWPAESQGKAKSLYEHAWTPSLKLPQFCCSGRHCFGKDPWCSPYLLQVIIHPSFSQFCLLAQHPPRGKHSSQVKDIRTRNFTRVKEQYIS